MADLVNAVLEFLKLNGTISDLEKDIFDTADKLFKQPFSREDVQKKVGENYQKHYDIIFSAGLVLGGNFMPFQDLSDKELRANLCVQLKNVKKFTIEPLTFVGVCAIIYM